jgi:hypothetical protein
MIEIKSYLGTVLHRSEKNTLIEAMEESVASGAYLGGADLVGAELIGARPVLMLGPIGSRSSYLTAYLTDAGVKIAAGCWTGSLDEFVRATPAKEEK